MKNQEETVDVKKAVWKVTIASLAMIAGFIVIILVLYGCMMLFSVIRERNALKVYTDIEKYEYHGDYRNLFKDSIWPEKLELENEEKMKLIGYTEALYNSWEMNKIGYLELQYGEEAYEAEISRLRSFSKEEYVDENGVKPFEEEVLLAMNHDEYGYCYALLGEDRHITYVEIYYTDGVIEMKDFSQYIPEENQLKGFSLESE